MLGKCCCNTGCYKYLWNIFDKYPQGPTKFLTDVHKVGATGWSISGGLFPQYAGATDQVFICDAGSSVYAAEVLFNGLPNGSDVTLVINTDAALDSLTGSYVSLRTDATGGSAYLQIKSAGVTTETQHTTNITGYALCNLSVFVYQVPISGQWILGVIWNPQAVGPNICPAIYGTEWAGGALIPTLVTDDGTGAANDLNLDTGGRPELDPFPTCGMDTCSGLMTLPLSGKPTRNGIALRLSGTLPIQIVGVGVATPTPDGFWNSHSESFDTASDCAGFPLGPGMNDCTVYGTISGVNATTAQTPPCNSRFNGAFVFQSVKGIMAGRAGNNTGNWTVQVGSLFLETGNAGNDCCATFTLVIIYDRTTGYTSLELIFIPAGSTTADGCPSAITQYVIASYSDNVGFAGLSGGMKTSGDFASLTLTPTGITVPHYDVSGATLVITGSDGDTCAPQDCVGSSPPPPPTCDDYAIAMSGCTEGVSFNPGDAFEIKINGTSIGIITVPGSPYMGLVEFWSTISQTLATFGGLNPTDPWVADPVDYMNNMACEADDSHPIQVVNASFSAALIASGSNTIEVIFTPATAGTYGELVFYIWKTKSDGTICDEILDGYFTYLTGAGTISYNFTA
jgi:hypothetical protein